MKCKKDPIFNRVLAQWNILDTNSFYINKHFCKNVMAEYEVLQWKEFNETNKIRKKANDHHVNAGEYFINRHYSLLSKCENFYGNQKIKYCDKTGRILN
jgi:hypothetical protein